MTQDRLTDQYSTIRQQQLMWIPLSFPTVGDVNSAGPLFTQWSGKFQAPANWGHQLSCKINGLKRNSVPGWYSVQERIVYWCAWNQNMLFVFVSPCLLRADIWPNAIPRLGREYMIQQWLALLLTFIRKRQEISVSPVRVSINLSKHPRIVWTYFGELPISNTDLRHFDLDLLACPSSVSASCQHGNGRYSAWSD